MRRSFPCYFFVLFFGLIVTTQLVAQDIDFAPVEKLITPSADFVGCMNVKALESSIFWASSPLCASIVRTLNQQKITTGNTPLPLFYVIGNMKNQAVYFLMKTQMSETEVFDFLTAVTAIVAPTSTWKKESQKAVCLNPYNGEKIYFFKIQKDLYFLGNQARLEAIQKQLKLNTRSPLVPNLPMLAKKSHFFLSYVPSQKSLKENSQFKLRQISVFDQESDGKKYIYGIAQTQPFKNPTMMRVFYISLINGYLFQETKSQEKTAQLMKCIALSVKSQKTILRIELNTFSMVEVSKILLKNRMIPRGK